jgi:hypothetical protein
VPIYRTGLGRVGVVVGIASIAPTESLSSPQSTSLDPPNLAGADLDCVVLGTRARLLSL